ncbi:LysR family transcriptional regulator [Methylobacterium sp. Leaf91]|uniref:helix-turn-helix domain-containing protein n=1 Tax=unclassified Methylobacterium TaxID=2615210 RepID=UPI001AEF3123|nr:LysR family transcriptional regulator [Methylobacterium sp. Leaf91]
MGSVRHAAAAGSTPYGCARRGPSIARENLTEVRSFATVSPQDSFVLAAARLGVPQSALSRAMTDLDEQLGMRLLTDPRAVSSRPRRASVRWTSSVPSSRRSRSSSLPWQR